MTWILIYQGCRDSKDCSYDDDIHFDSNYRGPRERPNLKMLVGTIRQQVNLVIIVISYFLLYWMFSFVANPC